MVGILLNNEFERTWKEEVITIKVLYQNKPEVTQEDRESLSSDLLCPGDLNQATLENILEV
jgi:hypothetical protein